MLAVSPWSPWPHAVAVASLDCRVLMRLPWAMAAVSSCSPVASSGRRGLTRDLASFIGWERNHDGSDDCHERSVRGHEIRKRRKASEREEVREKLRKRNAKRGQVPQ